MVEYRCPVCGKPVLPTFKFCKACGARLPKRMFKEKDEPEEDLHATSFGSEITVNDSTEEDFSLTDDIVYALAVKGRLILIDKEMEEILEEIENLEERVKVGLVPKEDAKNRVDELNKRFVEIKIEKKQLKKKSTPIPIFELIDKKETAKERLSKLKGLKKEKSISQKTYEKMEREYREEIATTEKAITNELLKMERWKDQLKKQLAQKRETLETLFVRKSTGELTEDEYNKERAELSEEIKNWEAALEELQKTLKKLK
ncbi:MAG: zinc-ribbon domain-containing protein [Candidatus Heimdallarchaeota archaeon]